MSAARSIPPQPPQAKRLPVVRLRSLRRFRGRIRAAAVLDALMKERGISNEEVAETIGTTEKTVREMRYGSTAVAIGDVFAMQRRMALAYLDAVRVAVLSSETEHA